MTSDRLVRVREGRLAAGVCTGLGQRFRVDPLVIRVGFAVLVFATLIGLLLYVAAALLMGDEDGGPSQVERIFQRTLEPVGVLGVLGGLYVVGTILGLAGQGLVGGVNTDGLTILAIFGLVLLAVQARGVDLVEMAKSLPDKVRGVPFTPEPPAGPTVVQGTTIQQEWVDLATLTTRTVTVPVTSRPVVEKPRAHSCRPSRPRQPRSWLSSLTLLAGVATAASLLPVAAGYPAPQGAQIVLAAGLSVVGLGLVAGTWAGRPRGLVAVGALLSVGLLGSAATGELPQGSRFGEVHWRPLDPAAAQKPFRLIAGDGVLDLTGLALRPGQRVVVHAELGVGGLRVQVPAAATLDLHVSTGLGDVTVDKAITSGPRARVTRVYTGSGPQPPIVELRVRGRLGDLEVNRA